MTTDEYWKRYIALKKTEVGKTTIFFVSLLSLLLGICIGTIICHAILSR